MSLPIDALDTPCVLIDLDRADANLRRAQDYADQHGVHLRPHIKTHKLPSFALRQVELGAIGITCQKLGEAEVMADAGIEDIFLPYNLIGEEKLHRLARLAARVKLAVTADSEFVVAGYGRTFAQSAEPLTVLVECDTGAGRCGVQTPEDAVALARIIAATPGLVFGGLMTYPAAGGYKETRAWLQAAITALEAAGLPARIISTGGTPDIWHAHEAEIATEYRPGTYIYLDRSLIARGDVGTFDDCALTVLATVVSRPTADRAIIDAGSKALTSDLLGMTGYGYVVGYPEAVIYGLSEEHGNIDFSASARKPAVGERLRIVPNHACPVSNLYDYVHLVSGDHVVRTERVAARGRVD